MYEEMTSRTHGLRTDLGWKENHLLESTTGMSVFGIRSRADLTDSSHV